MNTARLVQARQSGQISYFAEAMTVSVYVHRYSNLHDLWDSVVIDIYPLIYRDLIVFYLNGKYPIICVTDLRDIWN